MVNLREGAQLVQADLENRVSLEVVREDRKVLGCQLAPVILAFAAKSHFVLLHESDWPFLALTGNFN